MTLKENLRSEGEALDAFLADLEGSGEVKEIAGLETGFPGLSRALNGVLPGLYFLIGPPACGKTAFAKQLLDQVALGTNAPAALFSFSEKKSDLRIRTLARLSGLETREIRKGRGFLLHWYGVPKGSADPDRLPPGWEKLKRVAQDARSWLNRLYLFECDEKTRAQDVEAGILKVGEVEGARAALVVIDDSHRLEPRHFPMDERLLLVAEELQALAARLQVSTLAVWPDLRKEEQSHDSGAEEWVERAPGADGILVMENDRERTERLTEPARAINLRIVKNRGGEKECIPFDFFPPFSQFTEL